METQTGIQLVVTGTGRRKGRKGTGKDGSANRYTVVTGMERRRGRKRTGQDGNIDRYTVVRILSGIFSFQS
jgi:hypothetical protein